MKALAMKGYGGNDVLEIQDPPKPSPEPNQVLIQVTYAGLNPVDYKIRNGDLKQILPLKFPHIMGNEVAGVVEQTGSQVPNFKPGDRVVARLSKSGMGGFAQWVAEDAANVSHSPDSIGDDILAGVPLVALTAWQSLVDIGGLKPSDHVLIQGGGGSVGRFAIQIAKSVGATVSTTVSDWAVPLVKELGADVVINYRKEKFEDRSVKYDLVYDLVGGDTLDRSFGVTKPGGQVISIAGSPEPNTAGDLDAGWVLRTLFWVISRRIRAQAQRAGVSYRFVFMRPSGNQLAKICALLESKELVATNDRVFPITDYREAFETQQSGKAKGKLVFKMNFD